ncbi:O-antigen ligase family protein [Pacificibacter marinus]|uniref:O-Antigen ligase n=1 Tax=Pacificibacter marinus TaxID=658057 RepID=A0A1Y5TAY5_9RHOB|nr:O-antigen ligase family protein [Pacificibacter marinus]SEL10246.1 O-antigen ligase like membrane protein [Pacificibacter marinus]SLN59929.1 O-Antigen ligase [Pacificibacter marinus]
MSMDFEKIRPVQAKSGDYAQLSEAAFETQMQFDEVLIPDSVERFAAPNAANSLYIRVIGLLILLIPIPLGSNRPVPWALWALVIAILVFAFMLRIILNEPERKLRFLAQADILCLALVMPVFALFQLLPLGHLFPGAFPADLAPRATTLNAPATILGVLRLMTYAGIFILTLEVCSRLKRVQQLSRYVFWGLTAHAIVAMIFLTTLGDRFPWGEKSSYIGWATGTFINRNSFASFLGLGILTGVALFLERRQKSQSLRRSTQVNLLSPRALETGVYALCVVLMATALLATGSRMGTAATICGVLTTFFVMMPGRAAQAPAHTQGHGKILLGLGLILGFIFVVVFSRDIGERLLFSSADIGARLALYHSVWDLILSRPLVGYGLDTFSVAFPLIHDESVSSALIWDLAHNSYLALWAEMGLIAGSAPILALGFAAVRLLRAARGAKEHKLAYAISLGALVLAAVHSLLDFSFEIEANTVLLIVLVAMGLSQTRKAQGRLS